MKNTEIFIIDDVPPEGIAMLQALYSRDPHSVTEHLKKVAEVGPGKFMASYYVGYGHKSIGDCGSTTIFVEQVSMLVAKAIQDWALYNGQEASTRYLNMAGQAVRNPLNTKEGKLIQDEWMRIYSETLAELVPFLKSQFPKAAEEKDAVYEKAINAKAFDIARSLLPAAATTLLSWHTNLRQAHDHLQQLRHHPLQEVRDIASQIHSDLKGKYPSSFVHKEYPEQEAYIEQSAKELTYFHDPSITKFKAKSSLDLKGLKKHAKLLKTRPVKTELHHSLRKYGTIRYSFPLDFGSFRDLQRHRSGVLMMPLLTTDLGFFPWYLEQLPDSILKKVTRVIKQQEKRITKLKCSPEVKQYYIAMGYAVSCQGTFNLPASIYLAELRSGQTVHPTLRIVAQQTGQTIHKLLPKAALYCDMSPDVWNIKRGMHDIVKKEQK